MFGITKLGLLNYFVQFLFVRIYKSFDEDGRDYYGITYFVLPLSGWFNNFIILNRSKTLKFKPFKK
jgi:hypothetical protein